MGTDQNKNKNIKAEAEMKKRIIIGILMILTLILSTGLYADMDTGIEVTMSAGGELFLNGELVATVEASVWGDATQFIPISAPGRYTVKLRTTDGAEVERVVDITTRGIIKLNFGYFVGGRGPAGGIIFYDKGNTTGGWRYLEAAPSWNEFNVQWTSLNLGTNFSFGNSFTSGGFTDWFMPNISELSSMFQNLFMNGWGSFSGNNYWSSSVINPGSSVRGINLWYNTWECDESGCDGTCCHEAGFSPVTLNKNNIHTVRPIRRF